MATSERQPAPGPAASDAAPAASVLDQVLRERRAVDEDHLRSAQDSIKTLLRQIDRGAIKLTADMRLELTRRIGEINAAVEAQVNRVLHHPDFQKLEATWRGLHYLVRQAAEAGPEVRLQVLNAPKADLIKDLAPGREFDQSALWNRVYEKEYGMLGGKPYGALVGDYEFSRSPQDVELLKRIAGVAAGAHAPFLAAAAPGLFGWQSYEEEADTPKLEKLFRGAEYTRWRAFRESDEARYVGLCLPKFLLRLPHGRDTMPADGFDFEEDVDGRDHGKYLWGNAAYALAGRRVESFADYGWYSAIRGTEGGGLVSDLPIHNFRTDLGPFASKCPTEVALSDRREKEYSDLGFIPLVYEKDSDHAVFFGAQSVHKPAKYTTDAANANARLGAQLPYILATSRIAHYLKAMARDKVGSYTSREICERELNEWIIAYVTEETVDQRVMAEKPFREARIDVTEVLGRPGCYNATAYLRPHYMLDELSVSLRLVAELPPSVKS